MIGAILDRNGEFLATITNTVKREKKIIYILVTGRSYRSKVIFVVK